MVSEDQKRAEEHYKKALEVAREELAELMIQQDEIETRIAKLRQTIVSLSSLEDDGLSIENIIIQGRTVASVFGEPDISNVGITELIRDVLRAANDYITPTEVRDGLLRMGLDLEGAYTNPLAVIHTTLKRLVASGVAEPTAEYGKVKYRWKRPAARYPTPEF